MSVKHGVIMPEERKKSTGVSEKVGDKLSTFRRKVLRLYLQYVNPKLAKATEAAKEPGTFIYKLLPQNIGLWLAIAAAITGLLVLIMPDRFWNWQIVLFLSIFLIGPALFRMLQGVRSTFYNLLVAYPGKHLLNQEIVLENAIVAGSAEVTLHGENWLLKGEDYPVGTRVTVIAIKENVLFVTAV